MADAGLSTADPAQARAAARAILAEGRFHAPDIPHPLRGVISTVGDVVSAPLNAVERLIGSLGNAIPGGVAGVWAGFALIVVAAVFLVGQRRARLALTLAAAAGAGGSPVITADSLERAAAKAERDGDLTGAVRLRFRAGLMALGEARIIRGAAVARTSEVSRVLQSAPFDALAQRFDEIAYGGAAATSEDVDAQRRDWPAILASRARR